MIWSCKSAAEIAEELLRCLHEFACKLTSENHTLTSQVSPYATMTRKIEKSNQLGPCNFCSNATKTQLGSNFLQMGPEILLFELLFDLVYLLGDPWVLKCFNWVQMSE